MSEMTTSSPGVRPSVTSKKSTLAMPKVTGCRSARFAAHDEHLLRAFASDKWAAAHAQRLGLAGGDDLDIHAQVRAQQRAGPLGQCDGDRDHAVGDRRVDGGDRAGEPLLADPDRRRLSDDEALGVDIRDAGVHAEGGEVGDAGQRLRPW